MSYPPRPPMGMPPMGPGMMPRYPPYHMGMMPGMHGMGMMPMMPPVPPMNRNPKKLVPQEIPKKSGDEKPPVTTVFVGNISERAPDAMVRQMLQRCGNVLSWKRVQGASGKLQAFGFCEYEDPEATLRCIRLLNEWRIADKSLVVKVDAKTKNQLDDYKRKKRQKANGTSPKKDINNKLARLEQHNNIEKLFSETYPDLKNEEDGAIDSDKDEGEIVEEERMSDDDDDELDEFCQREDRVAQAGLDAIMREYSHDLAKVPAPEMTAEQKREKRREKKEKEKIENEPGLDDMELGTDELSLITREIKSFRDAHKDTEDPNSQKEQEREREREREMRRRREMDWEREREREREKERERERDSRRERDRERDRRERDYASGRRSRSRSRERTREHTRERSESRSVIQIDCDIEDEEDAYERRKLERKVREKEAAYQELLKKWEARERKKTREYEKEVDRENDRKSEEAREARRLKEFLEDYDDDQDDPKYYKGSALQRRLKEREKEMEADERDRQREKEELEEIRKKLEEEGHPDIEAEMARIEKERDEHLMPRLHVEEDSDDDEDEEDDDIIETNGPDKENIDYNRQSPSKENSMEYDQKPLRLVDADSTSGESSPDSDGAHAQFSPERSESTQDSMSQSHSLPEVATREEMVYTQHDGRLGFSGHISDIAESESPEAEESHDLPQQLPLPQPLPHPEDQFDQHHKRRKLTVGDVFNQDEEESASDKKKHRLVPLDYSDEEKAALIITSKPTTAEEKRKCIKNLIEKIPTGKEELFAFRLDWSQVDQLLMDRRIKPWVNKKIVEYIGEEEPTLTEFICSKVMANSPPDNILSDVAMVLDEEAEVFVVKMWRLLIYETEAKKLGLVK